MTDHKTGSREEWLKARLELLDAEKELTRREDDLARMRQELPWVPIERSTASRPTRAARLWPTSSADARSCSSTTSCSGLTTRQAAPPAQRSPTASPAPSCTSPITTSRSQRYRGRRLRSCRHTSSGWAGVSRGRPHSRVTSITTSTCRTPNRNGNREPSSTTSAPPTIGLLRRIRRSSRSRRASVRTR